MHLRRRRQATATGAVAAVSLALLLAACSSSPSTGSGSSSTGTSLSGTLNGSGSTLQLVFQQAAIQAFKATQPNMTVNYAGVGSGTGRTNLAAGTVAFAGSDSPIPADETANFKGKTVLYFPDVISPVTVSYNVPGVSGLKLSAPTIAGIFQGKITKWNDSAIKADNPGVNLPGTAITIARRSDSSGRDFEASASVLVESQCETPLFAN
jgi:phosphate transport system substrate-binding protein